MIKSIPPESSASKTVLLIPHEEAVQLLTTQLQEGKKLAAAFSKSEKEEIDFYRFVDGFRPLFKYNIFLLERIFNNFNEAIRFANGYRHFDTGVPISQEEAQTAYKLYVHSIASLEELIARIELYPFVDPRNVPEEKKLSAPVSGSALANPAQSIINNIISVEVSQTNVQTVYQSFPSEKSGEIARMMQSLSDEIKKTSSKITEDVEQQLKDDFETLHKELARKAPREKAFMVSIEGLKKAAKDIGEIGLPILNVAGKIIEIVSPFIGKSA